MTPQYMTADEFYTAYGDVTVTFHSYYKYTFTYKGVLPGGKTITIRCGGDASDIYRHEVTVDVAERVVCLQPFAGEVRDGDTVIVDFYDPF